MSKRSLGDKSVMRSSRGAEPAAAEPSAKERPPRQRRSQAERSESTRRRLLEAAAKLLRQRGYGGLRSAEVSAVAGVSCGAQLHHFPTKNDLIVAALRYLNEQTVETSRRRAERAQKSADPLDHLVADACEFYFGDYFFIELSIGMGDGANEDLRKRAFPIIHDSRFMVEKAWLETLEASGMPASLAAEVLALTLSVVRGFAMRTLIEDDPEQFKRLLKTWRKIVGNHIEARTKPARTDP
jgi:AcrR family transcriptional regulator